MINLTQVKYDPIFMRLELYSTTKSFLYFNRFLEGEALQQRKTGASSRASSITAFSKNKSAQQVFAELNRHCELRLACILWVVTGPRYVDYVLFSMVTSAVISLPSDILRLCSSDQWPLSGLYLFAKHCIRIKFHHFANPNVFIE
jgi:hypothetical protein